MGVIKFIQGGGGTAKATVYDGPWTSGDVYKENEQISHNGDLYLCILDNIAGSTSEPGVGATWQTYWVSQATLLTVAQQAALAGTYGTPQASNAYVTTTDPRITNVVVTTQTVTAGEALLPYKLLYCNPIDGKYYHASTMVSSASLNVVAMTQALGISSGSTGTVILSSAVLTNSGWAMTQGQPQFLDVTGNFVNVSPAINSILVGFALSPISLFFIPNVVNNNFVFDVNGNLLEIDYVPVNSTPTINAACSATNQLAAILDGLDIRVGIKRVATIAATGTTALTIPQVSNTRINQYGASGTVTYTLPLAAAGYELITVISTAGQTLNVHPTGSDVIYLAGTLLTAGHGVSNTSKASGDIAEFTTYMNATGGYNWYCKIWSGTWVDQGS